MATTQNQPEYFRVVHPLEDVPEQSVTAKVWVRLR